MVRPVSFPILGSILAAALVAHAPAQQNAPAPRALGLKVTYAPTDPDQKQKEGAHSYRVRLLSLAVERGETPTPMISPGLFEATFRGYLTLPVRDRYRFQVEGKGQFELAVNGQKILSGLLRPGRPAVTEQAVRLDKGDNEVTARVESSTAGDVQLRVLWSSSEFAFEPIAPEAWQWPQDDAEIAHGERLRRGHQVFVERRCARCHETDPPASSAFGELDQKGPDLRNVGARLHPAFLAEWLRDPRAVRADAAMPRFRAEKESDYLDLAAWLATMGQPLEGPKFTAEMAAVGETRWKELGCIACHLSPKETATPALGLGRMPLDFVPRKWLPVALEQYLLAPSRDDPHTRMPDFRLEADDARALAAFLLQGAAPAQFAGGDAEQGRRIAQRHGCDRCHDVVVPETGKRFREVRSLHQEHGCLGNDEDAPDHGLQADDLAAVRAFLPHALLATTRRSPLDYEARMLPALRCTQCHGMDGSASVWARLAAAAPDGAPLPPEQDPVAQGVPALSWVGSKLQPGWMERFVTGKEPSPRPWLHARMPGFGQPGALVIAGLVRAHGYGSQDEPEAAPDAQLAIHGARLVKLGEGFACVQCHGVGDRPPVQVFERQGINFAVAAARLRRDYYMRWMLDPLRIDPEARMPRFADTKGRTPFTDVLDGDARRQFDAIWHWFRTLK